VSERTAELQHIVNLLSGREIRMAELQEEIRRLQQALPRSPKNPFPTSSQDPPSSPGPPPTESPPLR
jgi:hypothetical protein